MQMSNSHIILTQSGIVAIASVGEAAELERNATAAELKSVEGITSASRRAERLAWRALLRSLEPKATIEYLPSGKPQILNSKYQHISVSHCSDSVVVALSEKPCGVDVERIDRNFERVKSRYISEPEFKLSAELYWAAVVWCAKEALYKMAGREGVDFKKDIVIKSAHRQGVSLSLIAELFGHDQVELRGEIVDDNHILVYTI